MRKAMATGFTVFLACIIWLYQIGCTAQQVKDTATTVNSVATAAQSILPPPFGVIASAVAGVAAAVASLAASKIKGNAVATGATPHPIADFLSSHSWIYPSVTALVGLANSMGWIHVSTTEIGTLATAMGLATGVQVVADNHAEAQAPVPVAPKA